MKKITKFLLNVTSVGSILSIATLNAFQLTVVGQTTPNLDGQPITQPGRVRFVGPTEDNLSSPNDRRVRPSYAGSTCDERSKIKLTALVPESLIGRTVSEYPVFFFYLPKSDFDDTQAEFALIDEKDNFIYETPLKIKNSPGVMSVSIPANKNVPPLEAGKNYRWSIALICYPEDRSTDVVATGIVRRVELSADILRELDAADPPQKTVIYAQNGIWQDALSTLAAVRRANPNNTDLAADWESLLDSVKLGEIAAEPLLPIEPQP
ncbi:DUF928 domain-containing protein [Microcoleus sp. AR_TQ3_B6]|uniref:DUF928 domain-containing protein n=1 Tax=Microcoleus sp. AR_TQ3_B6 TaxID=3055284 RepID=UPI002FD53806